MAMPDGRIHVFGGASATEEEDIHFELAASSGASSSDAVHEFTGELRMLGHAGMLEICLADPQVIISGERGEMSVRDPEATREGLRIPLVCFEVTTRGVDGDLVVLVAGEVRLLEAAVELFGGVYRVGEPFDPVLIALPSAAADRIGDPKKGL